MSVIDGDEWSASCSSCFIPCKRPPPPPSIDKIGGSAWLLTAYRDLCVRACNIHFLHSNVTSSRPTLYYTFAQGDPFWGSPELIIINHAITYRWTRNFVRVHTLLHVKMLKLVHPTPPLPWRHKPILPATLGAIFVNIGRHEALSLQVGL
jgi:hypothetical protein